MWGVVLTDAIQTAVIMIGVPILAVATLIKYTATGGSVGEIFTTPFIPKGMGTQFIYLVLPFLLSISVSYDAYARIQSAKDAKTASRGCLWGGALVIVVGLLCSVIGVAARPLFPGVEDGIFTITAMGGSQSGAGGNCHRGDSFRGHVQCELCYTVSRIVFSRDLYNKVMHPEVENLDQLPKAKHISQIAVFLGSLVGIFFAFHMTDILDAMIIFNYPYMGSLLIPLLGGLLWKGATEKRRFAAAVAGGIVGVGAFLSVFRDRSTA